MELALRIAITAIKNEIRNIQLGIGIVGNRDLIPEVIEHLTIILDDLQAKYYETSGDKNEKISTTDRYSGDQKSD